MKYNSKAYDEKLAFTIPFNDYKNRDKGIVNGTIVALSKIAFDSDLILDGDDSISSRDISRVIFTYSKFTSKNYESFIKNIYPSISGPTLFLAFSDDDRFITSKGRLNKMNQDEFRMLIEDTIDESLHDDEFFVLYYLRKNHRALIDRYVKNLKTRSDRNNTLSETDGREFSRERNINAMRKLRSDLKRDLISAYIAGRNSFRGTISDLKRGDFFRERIRGEFQDVKRVIQTNINPSNDAMSNIITDDEYDRTFYSDLESELYILNRDKNTMNIINNAMNDILNPKKYDYDEIFEKLKDQGFNEREIKPLISPANNAASRFKHWERFAKMDHDDRVKKEKETVEKRIFPKSDLDSTDRLGNKVDLRRNYKARRDSIEAIPQYVDEEIQKRINRVGLISLKYEDLIQDSDTYDDNWYELNDAKNDINRAIKYISELSDLSNYNNESEDNYLTTYQVSRYLKMIDDILEEYNV